MPVSNNELLKEIRIMTSKLDQLTDTVNILEQKIDNEVLDINNEIAVIHTQISNCMLEVKNEFDNSLRMLQEKVDGIKAGNNNNEVQKSLELTISGIPETNGESLQTIVSVISTWIAFENNNSIVRTHRLKPTSQLSLGPISNVIVCFTSAPSRRLFLTKYFAFIKTGPLLLSHIGMNSHDRIYINENISKQTLELLKEAKALKRIGKLADAYVYDGQVCVIRRGNQGKTEIVFDVVDLRKYE